MSLELRIGLDVINSYKRLAYTAWHAIAEFVDNSTQSYFDHQAELDEAYARERTRLSISVAYDRRHEDGDGLLRIVDNAMGMSADELEHALHVALPPVRPSGRSRYGMGMKTAACWIGNYWTIRTKKLGETTEYTVAVDVDKIATGDSSLPFSEIHDVPSDQHYTILEIYSHNRVWKGRTLGKIAQFLSSMYREDFRRNLLTLEWQGSVLTWDDFPLHTAIDGSTLRRDFDFEVDGKRVHGWVGILAGGFRGRANAGFSILHSGRVVRGWPDAWRPQSIYGQLDGSNDLINQRMVGEINLDEFDVSHTKDDILWLGDQEDKVEQLLLEHCGDYRDFARDYRPTRDEQPGPSDVETSVALDELRKELEAPEMADAIEITVIPPEEVINESDQQIIEAVEETRAPELTVRMGGLPIVVKVYVAGDRSPNDPYVVTESAREDEVVIIVNSQHPHWGQLRGSEGVLNYLRHCVYDSVAEWKAMRSATSIEPRTIKRIKDSLLRVSFEIQERAGGYYN
ncbi:MAG: ATP-binding protein [Anaerolineae bacterium]|nr:ATP-binding protein [Anaerolineae bacterium]